MKNQTKPDTEIVLTDSAIEISDFFNNHFFAFMGGYSKGSVHTGIPRKLYPS